MERHIKQAVTVKKFGRPIEYTEKRIVQIADGLLEFMQKKENFWLKDYATELGIPHDVFTDLAERSEYFSRTFKLAKQIQESKLAKNGLTGKHNAQMSKFALMNVANWREQGQTDLTTGGNPLGYVALPPTIDIEDAEVIEVSDVTPQ